MNASASWIAAAGLLALTALAVGWITVAFGPVSDSVETASNLPMVLTLLLLPSSSFVPTASLPDPLRRFAENQPFTPIIETLRGLSRQPPRARWSRSRRMSSLVLTSTIDGRVVEQRRGQRGARR